MNKPFSTPPIRSSFYPEEDEIAAQFDATIEGLRGNAELNDQTRTPAIAWAFMLAVARFNKVRHCEDGEAHFGSTEDAWFFAFGDVDLIADEIESSLVYDGDPHHSGLPGRIKDPHTAASLLYLATTLHDEPLARAVGCQAYSEGWGDVLDAYLATRPTQAWGVAALEYLEAPNVPRAESFCYSFSRPRELSGLSDYEIALLSDLGRPDESWINRYPGERKTFRSVGGK